MSEGHETTRQVLAITMGKGEWNIIMEGIKKLIDGKNPGSTFYEYWAILRAVHWIADHRPDGKMSSVRVHEWQCEEAKK